ncbi:uncharacterized protein LOC126335190 [Schistocerca gregaria]|uniref:uncharacterized protein LOC126335190 n=1 Tax=Schistocerca gregaria TaxID=7010 RepID=UPI00211EE0BD|nr:uncharacterized protein LOC126335190 [Schistocerca gregaria]
MRFSSLRMVATPLLLLSTLACLSAMAAPAGNATSSAVAAPATASSAPLKLRRLSGGKVVEGGGRADNHLLLRSLGLSRRRSGHHRKRLAAESRRLAAPGDSHVFVVKLPPDSHFYGLQQPHPNDVTKVRPPVSFAANGKPSAVYHWNLPARHLIAAKKSRARTAPSRLQASDDSEVFYVSPHKHPNDHHGHHYHHHKKPSFSFYAPKMSRKKAVFHKYFPGNGKPQSFYVIAKAKKPASYHKLML